MIDEGLFSADRHEIKIYAPSKEELLSKIKTNQEKFVDHEPKVSNIKTDKLGRFFVNFSYGVNEKGNKETIWAKVGRGIDKTKEVINKGKNVANKVLDKMPRQSTLTALTGFRLGQEQAKVMKDHPDAVFGTKYKNSDGSWSIDYSAKKKIEPNIQSSQDSINNIQKVLNKLSNDKLKKIEDIIK